MDKIVVHLDLLKQWFARHQRVLIALSGGVDSCLVAHLARSFLGRSNAVAVISHSASLKASDLADARAFCVAHDIHLEVVDAREIDDPNYRANPGNRCYFCKTALYHTLKGLVEEKFAGYAVLNGNNYSDFGDHRPGLLAADEFRVLSPLAECSLQKEDIRRLARHLGLEVWDKPASPCLSSRFPYGQPITRAKLRQVEEGEQIMLEHGFRDVRLRHYGDEARLEVPAEQIARLRNCLPTLKPLILALGFDKCTIDEEGLVSGKLNRALGHAQ